MNIREFSLAWRWTRPSHAVLPDHVLSQMQPVQPPEAMHLDRNSRGFLIKDGLDPSIFTVTTISADGLSQDLVRQWLREQQPDLSVQVVVLWAEDTAIRTTWAVVTAYWDDFCYPSSDDVLVWPVSVRWALLYHHTQTMQFGQRRVCDR